MGWGSCAGAWPYKLYTGNILLLLNLMQNEGRGKMNKGEITKIVNFMTSEAGVLVLGCDHISHIYSECIISLKIVFPIPGINQTNLVCNNDDQERVYQNCKFYDPRGRRSCARTWQYYFCSENALFL